MSLRHLYLPGRCMGCGAPVVWNLKAWRDPGQYGHRHVCPDRCNAPMPRAEERCARRPGHTTEHRTAYAMDNARRKGLVG